MELFAALAELSGSIVFEPDLNQALDRLAQTASKLTASRTALFALMNDEHGAVEITNGFGEDWNDKAKGVRFPIQVKDGGSIVAYVAAKGSRFLSGNVAEEKLYHELFGSSQSELAVPIKDRHGRTRAVLNIESDQPDAYGLQETYICEIIADLASLVLHRDELERRENALMEVGMGLDRAESEEALVSQILDVASRVLLFQSCSIFLFDPVQDMFMLRGSVGPLKEQVGKVGYRAGEGLTGWVCEHGEVLRVDQPQTDPRWLGRWLEIPGAEIASYLAVPIEYRERTIGCVRVLRRSSDNPHRDSRFTSDDERILSAIAEQFATGLENLRAMQSALRVERMAAWGELSAKSSHMIGNRVFALRGDINELGHLLGENPMPVEELVTLQKSLTTNVTRIEEILQEFRDFVTATQLTRVEMDINELVAETVREVFPRRSTIQLIMQLDPDIPRVQVDPRKLQRAVSEIVENSLSFFDKGTLAVTTRLADEELKRRARMPIRRPYVVIEIADQGPGVEPDRKSLIFQPFHSSRVKGMGLGLSIVKGIVNSHGGEVLEEGEPGKGARFVILLPVQVP